MAKMKYGRNIITKNLNLEKELNITTSILYVCVLTKVVFSYFNAITHVFQEFITGC